MHPDQTAYAQFCGRKRMHTLLATLEGLLLGLSSDGAGDVNDVTPVLAFLDQHADLIDRPPLREIGHFVRTRAADGVLDAEEIADIVWLCQRLQADGKGFDAITSDIQRLHGVLAGIVADQQVSDAEVVALTTWMQEHTHLSTAWPYQDLYALLHSVLEDGRIDADERAEMLAYFSQFVRSRGHKIIGVEALVTDCSPFDRSPDITFAQRTFCFTGSSERGTRADIVRLVEQRGGLYRKGISRRLHYLVVGVEGNPCWTFNCYGRKIEAAKKLQDQGAALLIVHEHDFWAAVD